MIEVNEDLLQRLRPLWLDMLLEVDRICRKHNIKYSLDGGTLLGCIRHKGFIPWDDDVDVIMLREEYEKFVAVCKNELDTEKFFLQDFRTDKEYRWGWGKLRYNDTIFLHKGQETGKWHPGVFLDIFCYDGVPDNYILRRLHLFTSYCVRKGLYSVFGRLNTENIFLRCWYKLLYLIPRSFWVGIYDSLVKLSNRSRHELVRHLCYPYRPEKPGGMPRKYGLPRICCDEYVEREFAGHSFKTFKNADLWLHVAYDDYMTIPPEDERKASPLSILKLPGEDVQQ